MNKEKTFRFHDALARLAGDREMLAMLAAIAAEDAPPMLTKLDEYAGSEDASAYTQVAHSLKGLLSTFETGEPVSEIQSIIDVARKGDGKAIQPLHKKLSPDLKHLIHEIQAIH